MIKLLRQAALAIILMLGLSVGPTAAQQGGPGVSPADVGTGFTYQAQPKNASGNPIVSATCNFQFGLWTLQTGGSQIGSTPSPAASTDAGGYFTVSLDFGAGAFDGTPRWLDIQVKCGTVPATRSSARASR